MTQQDDGTLGACGCVDYHMADCPTRDRSEPDPFDDFDAACVELGCFDDFCRACGAETDEWDTQCPECGRAL